jgi:transcription elongation factor Elf1
MKHDLDCPNCGSNMVKSYAKETKFRSKLIKWNHDGMFAVCKGCGSDVAIALDLLKGIQSSFSYEVPNDGQEFNAPSDKLVAIK